MPASSHFITIFNSKTSTLFFNPDFSNFPRKIKKNPGTDPYPEYPLLKGKRLIKDKWACPSLVLSNYCWISSFF